MQANHYLWFDTDDITKAGITRHLKDINVIPDIMNDEFEGEQAVKWRSRHDDMISLSAMFPTILFHLSSVDLDHTLEARIYHGGTRTSSVVVDQDTIIPDAVGDRIFKKIILTDPRVYLMRLFRK